jgi:uncharacterized membrane protein
MLFLITKYVHILSAIVAVGLNVSYAVWIIKAQRNPEHTAFTLKGIKFLDDRIANPAYGVLLVTGILMVFMAGYSITTLWIDIALVLFVVLAVLALTQYTPTLRSQIKLAESGDMVSVDYVRLAKRGQILGQALGVIVLVILAMMVFKPHL